MDEEVARRMSTLNAMRRIFRSGRIRILLLVLGGIILLGLIPGHIDPTEQSFEVRIRNDTSKTIVLKQCDNDCRSFHERVRLTPGAVAKENASDEADVTNWFLVTDESEHPLGCLGLRFDRKIEGLVIPISHMGRCRHELLP